MILDPSHIGELMAVIDDSVMDEFEAMDSLMDC